MYSLKYCFCPKSNYTFTRPFSLPFVYSEIFNYFPVVLNSCFNLGIFYLSFSFKITLCNPMKSTSTAFIISTLLFLKFKIFYILIFNCFGFFGKILLFINLLKYINYCIIKIVTLQVLYLDLQCICSYYLSIILVYNNFIFKSSKTGHFELNTMLHN